MPHIQVHVGSAYTLAPLPQTAGPPQRVCIWSRLELGPFQAPRLQWPPLSGDPMASQATQGGSLKVWHGAQFSQEAL